MASDRVLPRHPGETIRKAIEALDDIQHERQVALRMGISTKHLSQLLNGRVTLTPEMALKVEAAIGVPAEFAMTLQARYDVARLRAALAETTGAGQ